MRIKHLVLQKSFVLNNLLFIHALTSYFHAPPFLRFKIMEIGFDDIIRYDVGPPTKISSLPITNVAYVAVIKLIGRRVVMAKEET